MKTMHHLKLVQNRMDDDDFALMQRVGNGDVHAYQILVDRHTARCLRTAGRMLGNREDAEDVVQESWLKLWHEAAHWEPRAKLSTWLYRVVVNGCIDRQRKRGRTEQADMELFLDERPLAEEEMIMSERGRRMARAISALEKRQRVSLVLSYYEGLSNAEVAEIMGIKTGTLQVLLHRARNSLKKQLTE